MKALALLRAATGRESRAIGAALALLLAALALPPLALPRNVYHHVVVFDITQSMNVEDYELDGKPASRLDYARHSLHEALRRLPCGSRVGLGAFAEYRTLIVLAPIEVCSGYHDLLASVDQVNGRMRWGNASEVSKALFWSLRATRELEGAPNLVFLTDGHEAPPLRSASVLVFDDVKPGEIGGLVVGVGGDTPKPIPKSDESGKRVGYWRAGEVIQPDWDASQDQLGRSREHLSALREAHLRGLARDVGLGYRRLTDEASLAEAMRDERFARKEAVPTDLLWLPAALALLALALHFRPDVRRLLGRRGPPAT